MTFRIRDAGWCGDMTYTRASCPSARLTRHSGRHKWSSIFGRSRGLAHSPSAADLANPRSHPQPVVTCKAAKVTCSTSKPRSTPGSITAADEATQRLQRRDWAEQRGDWAVLAPPSRSMKLPAPFNGDAVVLVEGRSDANVVLRSVNAPVFVMGGTNSRKNDVALHKLHTVANAVPFIIALADPDAEGERFRGYIARELGNKVWHAFLPVSRAIAGHSTDNHGAGNVGIEHAQEADIAVALRNAQPYEAHAETYCREDLEEWELVNSWEEAPTRHAALRREIVCNALGLARMDGNKLVKALNHYSFPREQVRRIPWLLYMKNCFHSKHGCDVHIVRATLGNPSAEEANVLCRFQVIVLDLQWLQGLWHWRSRLFLFQKLHGFRMYQVASGFVCLCVSWTMNWSAGADGLAICEQTATQCCKTMGGHEKHAS